MSPTDKWDSEDSWIRWIFWLVWLLHGLSISLPTLSVLFPICWSVLFPSSTVCPCVLSPTLWLTISVPFYPLQQITFFQAYLIRLCDYLYFLLLSQNLPFLATSRMFFILLNYIQHFPPIVFSHLHILHIQLEDILTLIFSQIFCFLLPKFSFSYSIRTSDSGSRIPSGSCGIFSTGSLQVFATSGLP